jgi:DNA-binding transcriptional LysR family regulator
MEQSMSVYDHLEFRHLKYIMAIVEEGTFTAAAVRLHIVQSALSRQIRELEDILGVQIFEPGSATLTSAGESLLRLAPQLLDMRAELIDALQAIHQATMQPFRLGFTPFVDKRVLDTVSQAHRDLFPKGSISPENGDTNDLLQRLKEGTLDAALVTLPLDSDGYMVQSVMHEPLVVCLRRDDPLAVQEEIPPELLNGKLAIFSDPRHHPLAHTRLLEMLAEQGIEPRVSNPTFNAEHVQWMVREGLCVALIRQTESLNEDLTTRPIQGVSWTIDSAIVYRPEHDQMALPLLLRDLNRRFCVAGMKAPRKPPHSAKHSRTQEELPFGKR